VSGFRLIYDMNDIINYIIVNPWANNLLEMEKRLIGNYSLKIFDRIAKNGVIHLIGRTDIGTTYEILLVPSVIYNWMKWKDLNSTVPFTRQVAEFKKCVELQKLIDNTQQLR
jgi:hypothetical protein